jgi:hypothetical protein
VSIGKIQEKILTQKGCGTAIAIGMAFIMSFFIFGNCSKYQNLSSQGEGTSTANASVVEIGDVNVTSDQISQEVARESARQPSSSFDSMAQETSTVLSSELNNAAYQYIAKRDHLDLTDSTIIKAADGVIDEEFEMSKMQMQLKPGASQAEIDAAFKKRMNMTQAEAKKKSLDNVKQMLKKPDDRAKLLDSLIAPVVQSALGDSTKPSDQEVRASYDTFSIKRILVTRNSITDPKGVQAKAKAEQALKAIQGGMTFEAAMEKYSSEPPQAGKKIGDSVLNLPRSAIGMQPDYKVLLGQKVGFVSPVEESVEGFNIYKITAITNNAPKDFDASRDKYKKQYVQTQVQSKLQDEVKAILASKEVKWDNKGYEALYNYTKTFTMSPAERDATLQKVVTEAKSAMNNPAEKQPALMAWFEAETSIYRAAGPTMAKLAPGRIEVLNAVLESSEDYDLRMELVDLYTQQKKGSDALQNLVAASLANTLYDEQGQKRFGDLAAKADSLVKAKLLTEAQLKPFYDAQNQWRKSKKDDDANTAEMAAQAAKQKVIDAANEKANEEAMKKQKAAMTPPKATAVTKAPPTSTSTTVPTQTPSGNQPPPKAPTPAGAKP